MNKVHRSRSQQVEMKEQTREGRSVEDNASKKVCLRLCIQRGRFDLIPLFLFLKVAFPSCTQGGRKLNPALDNWNVTAGERERGREGEKRGERENEARQGHVCVVHLQSPLLHE